MLSPSRNRKGRQEVAAVCYRMRKQEVEFLLVQTRGGRWIFPKGGVEPGLTYAQSAALEAFEEAGVHGKMEKIPFTRYLRRAAEDTGKAKKSDQLPPQRTRSVTAHLCEVSRLERPQEENRNPTWFCADKAKLRLRADRTREFGLELTRVVDRAVSRIRRLHDVATHEHVHLTRDSLQQARFEPLDDRLSRDLLLAGTYLKQAGNHQSAGIERASRTEPRKRRVLDLVPAIRRPMLRLGTRPLLALGSGSQPTPIDAKKSDPSSRG